MNHKAMKHLVYLRSGKVAEVDASVSSVLTIRTKYTNFTTRWMSMR